jgi:hypothetical protein
MTMISAISGHRSNAEPHIGLDETVIPADAQQIPCSLKNGGRFGRRCQFVPDPFPDTLPDPRKYCSTEAVPQLLFTTLLPTPQRQLPNQWPLHAVLHIHRGP